MSPTPTDSVYRTTQRTVPTRARERASYDRELVHSILDEAYVCHLGFVRDGAPVVLPTAEIYSALEKGVVDGSCMPAGGMLNMKHYEVAKYASMTYHNYGPTVLVMNLDIWRGLTPEQQKLFVEVNREAQAKIREMTESVDNFQKAKEILEPKGMKVNQADVASFRKIAEEKIWPQYRQQYAEMWEKIVSTR